MISWEHSIICGVHYPEAKVVKRLSRCCELVEFPTDHYLLITQDGHIPKNVLIDFPVKPYPDPDPDCSDDHSIDAAADQWLSDAEAIEPLLVYPADTGHMVYEQCLFYGFLNDKGPRVLHLWLFDFVGKLVQEYEYSGKKADQPTT